MKTDSEVPAIIDTRGDPRSTLGPRLSARLGGDQDKGRQASLKQAVTREASKYVD